MTRTATVVRTSIGSGGRRTTRLAVLGAALAFAGLLSLAVGAKSMPSSTVIDAFTNYDAESTDHLIVRELRLPRTLLGVLVGAALGAAGASMQGVTRNPLADPGLLGVNAGAAFAVGLVVPHAARAWFGPDQRWLLPASALTGSAFLLYWDTFGRVVARPGEVQVGITTAAVGGPVFVFLVRRTHMAQL